ncbi:MAG: isopentenyl-diphosphate delta-isomerase idi1 [Chrysothrix sp. TS-e1954]|nr:MAG: isopentenyl-diphosphate delta-isomerase idi1 [Chrysothrix sp. TS-e1954]
MSATGTTTATTTIKSTDPRAHVLSSEDVLKLVPEVNTQLAEDHRTSDRHHDLEGYDEEQIRLMDEMCIVLDENDFPIGSASKKVCHLMDNIDKGLLHRAFSVFLFDSQNRLLLQQRASQKITFPDLWTNTCCSHPLGIPGETGATLDAAVNGVRRAAQRKLLHELGIRSEEVPLEKFDFLTRIHYLAASDSKWGEHESKWIDDPNERPLLKPRGLVDYIMFIKANVNVDVNQNEVQDSKYVTMDELEAMFADTTYKFTPWFRLICDSMLFRWWRHLDDGLEMFKNEPQIRRML